MNLSDLKPNPGAKHRRKRLGRGEGSGLGKTSGRGHKGQKARSGGGVRPGFEGGQMPLARRLPKKGFSNVRFRTNYAIVNLADLEKVEGDQVNEQTLRAAGLIKGRIDGVKVLGMGEISRKLQVEVHKMSASAKEKLEGAGGTFVDLLAQSAASQGRERKSRAERRELQAQAAAETKKTAEGSAEKEKQG